MTARASCHGSSSQSATGRMSVGTEVASLCTALAWPDPGLPPARDLARLLTGLGGVLGLAGPRAMRKRAWNVTLVSMVSVPATELASWRSLAGPRLDRN